MLLLLLRELCGETKQALKSTWGRHESVCGVPPPPWECSQACGFKAERFVPHRLGGAAECLQQARAEDCIALCLPIPQNEKSAFGLVAVLSEKEPSSS